MKNKIVLSLLLVIGMFLAYDWYSVHISGDTFKEELKPNEKQKIIIDHKKKEVTKIIRKNDGTVETSKSEGVRKVEVTVSDNNTITVKERTRGLLWEPGIGLFYSKDTLNLGLDLQFLYWRKYGASIGVGISNDSKLSTYISCNYNIYSNTSLFVGINDIMNPVFGLKVSF